MEIRSADLADIEAIYELWLELMLYHKDHGEGFQLSSNPKSIVIEQLKKRIKAANTQFFVGVEEDRIVAFIVATIWDSFEALKFSKKGYIAETIVSEKIRGKNTGQLLYKTAEDWLIHQGADHIELQVSIANDRGIKFWKRNGFSSSTFHLIKQLKQ